MTCRVRARLEGLSFQWIIHGFDTAGHAKCMLILFLRASSNNNRTRFIFIRLFIFIFSKCKCFSPHPPRLPPPALCGTHCGRGPFSSRQSRCRWVNGPRRGGWRAKELVDDDGLPLWRVLGNPSMGNLFVKNRPLSGPPPSVRRRRRDENNNINLPPPLVVILLYVINLFSTLPVLLPPRSNYQVCLVLCFFFHYYLFILLLFFFFFFYYSPSTYQLNSNGFCLNDERRLLRININKKKKKLNSSPPSVLVPSKKQNELCSFRKRDSSV